MRVHRNKNEIQNDTFSGSIYTEKKMHVSTTYCILILNF